MVKYTKKTKDARALIMVKPESSVSSAAFKVLKAAQYVIPIVSIVKIVREKSSCTVQVRFTNKSDRKMQVVLDDYDSEISLVTRGADLYEQTAIHRLLQQLLSLPSPLYDHHRLICDDTGKRLAKRDDAKSLSAFRAQGLSADKLTALLPL